MKDDIKIDDLCAAIIFKAVQDYAQAIVANKDSSYRTIIECEQFFRSKWYEQLNVKFNIEGEELIKKIKTAAEEFRFLSEDVFETGFLSESIEPENRAFQCPICGSNVYARYICLSKNVHNGDKTYGTRCKCSNCCCSKIKKDKTVSANGELVKKYI